MKRIIIVLFIMLICGCKNKKYDLYNEYIKELNNVESSTENMPIDIEITIEKYYDNLYSYSALINKNNEEMNNVMALLLHNKETENIFPSIGIFDEKAKVGDKEGIKLSGYVENIEDIEFRLMISYTNKDNKLLKYYYINQNPTIID